MASSEMAVNLRCSKCTCREDDLVNVAVLEAARHYMAAHLVAERMAEQQASPTRPGSLEEYDFAVGAVQDALQSLRDALHFERVARG